MKLLLKCRRRDALVAVQFATSRAGTEIRFVGCSEVSRRSDCCCAAELRLLLRDELDEVDSPHCPGSPQ